MSESEEDLSENSTLRRQNVRRILSTEGYVLEFRNFGGAIAPPAPPVQAGLEFWTIIHLNNVFLLYQLMKRGVCHITCVRDSSSSSCMFPFLNFNFKMSYLLILVSAYLFSIILH